MSDGFTKRGQAAEESYFDRAEREALEKLRARQDQKQAVNSPITGQPMEIISFEGMNVMKCPHTGGVWLDSSTVKRLLPRLSA